MEAGDVERLAGAEMVDQRKVEAYPGRARAIFV